MHPDPFTPAHNGGQQLPRATRRPTRSARVKWKVKGKTDGPVYHGTTEVTPCPTCSSSKAKHRLAR